jgi:YD repeat-containing protein
VVASGYYNDALDRPTQVIRAANQSSSLKSQTTFTYDDAGRTITTTSDRDAFNDNLLKGSILYDGLGRTIESRQYENSTQYNATQQIPFAVLQDPDSGAWVSAGQSTNPFRPYLNEQPVWTTTFADSLGRASKVRTPDNAIARTSYSGNTVTVTDQAGKSRQSVSDALGRLTQVYEGPSGLNYLTSYTYDVLDELVTVNQGSQTRSFVYDSLKRMTSATNPESGTVSLTYDKSGNILTKTDARAIVTNVGYDALNRPISKSYTNDPLSTPSVYFYYDNQTLPAGAPSLDRGYATGALVAITYGGSSGSAGTYLGYDALGRTIRQYQQTDSVNYLVEASYSRTVRCTLKPIRRCLVTQIGAR